MRVVWILWCLRCGFWELWEFGEGLESIVSYGWRGSRILLTNCNGKCDISKSIVMILGALWEFGSVYFLDGWCKSLDTWVRRFSWELIWRVLDVDLKDVRYTIWPFDIFYCHCFNKQVYRFALFQVKSRKYKEEKTRKEKQSWRRNHA